MQDFCSFWYCCCSQAQVSTTWVACIEKESPGKLANYILPSPHRASRAAVQAGEDDLQTSSSRLPKTSTSSAASTGHKLLRP